MPFSFYYIKKWTKMVLGKSIDHVNQNEGLAYSFDSIKGYYNNLTEKVTRDKKNYYAKDVFQISDDKGYFYYFPISIFQYGLGAYDLFLLGKDKDLMKEKFLTYVKWAFDNQNEDGSWDNFIHSYPNAPFSAMAQGEGCSLLIRGFIETGDTKYLLAAKNALHFMLNSISNGGTAEYVDDGIVLYEYTCFPYVFNGWIFAIFGLMDYVTLTKDEYYKIALDKTINALKNRLSEMDVGYWSNYCKNTMIASPFYHKLHIAQLSVLAKYTNIKDFEVYKDRFVSYNKNPFKRFRAFFKKAKQKLFERN